MAAAGSSTPSADAASLVRERFVPNLFLAGNPKTGSTFLFSCLRAGPFDPNVLNGPFDAERWRRGAYLLTTLGAKKEFNLCALGARSYHQ